MSVLGWLVLGLGLGAAFGWLSGRRGREWLGYVVVGALGGLLGGFLASALLGLNVADLDWTSLGVAALGAFMLVLILSVLPPTDVFE
jgi:uncharacterized membrane protein YeaQ/YmgE (transglycosylase-associated protein family)